MEKNKMGTYIDINRVHERTNLENFNAEARKLGLSYGQLQARETLFLERSNKNVAKMSDLQTHYAK